MSRCKNYYEGWGRVAGVALFAAGWAVACGDNFVSSDCQKTRTCVDSGQGGEGAEGGERPAVVEGGANAGGAAGGEGGEGGATPECTAAVDCSNGDAADGAEACVAGTCRAGDPPPRVVSVSPADESDGAEPDAPILIEFSEALDPASVSDESVQVLDGETPVPGKLSYDGVVATFVPDGRLRLNASYDVVVGEAVTDKAGTPLLGPVRSTFRVREGAWHTTELPLTFSALAQHSPLAETGQTLLAWSGNGVDPCPVSVAWLGLGDTKVTPQLFGKNDGDCWSLVAGAGPTGVGAVAWTSSMPGYVTQYRAEAWQTQPNPTTLTAQFWVEGVAVSPLGVTTRFEREVRAASVAAVHTNAEGFWQNRREDITPPDIEATSPLSVAFDRAGNGVVAFSARNRATTRLQIMASRYSVESDKWETAQVIPGSETLSGAQPHQMGAPAVAMAPTGEALVVWRFEQIPSWLMSSYLDPKQGWLEAELASSRPNVYVGEHDQASVTYDGSRFLTAWAGESETHVILAHTASYQVGKAWSPQEEHDISRYVRREEYPQIASDGHGSSLLVWRTSEADDDALAYRWFTDGAWGPMVLLPGGDMLMEANAHKLTLYMNESGVASLTFPIKDAQGNRVAIRVLRFY